MNFKKILFALLAIISMGSTFLLSSCGKDENTIVVASKPHSEQYILCEIISQLIENKSSIKVKRKAGIGGGTSNIHPAIVKGEIDIYPEYTGTAWLFVLKKKENLSGDEILKKLKKEYLKKYNLHWFNIYGFNNTFTLAMKKDKAKSLNINNYTDLTTKGDSLTFGAEYDFFERIDGYKGLKKIYGMNFKNKKEMDIGLKYEALSTGQVDVINAFSTDGLLKKYNLKILQDDKSFFPAYEAATIIRKDTLKKYPELKKILSLLEGKISNKEMIDLNYRVENNREDPAKVAKEFLKSKGLL